jgi:hypothetical protein
MNPFHILRKTRTFASRSLIQLAAASLFAAFAIALASAQDLTPGLTYVCNGERLSIENCNIRDVSDTSTCMVGHPDHIQSNGLMQYTNMTRGALKKLFPTCQQPSQKQVAAAHNFQKRQEDTYNANAQKANDKLNAIEQAQTHPFAQSQKPRTLEERTINRCITSGRLPSSCTGNALLGAFGQMLSAVLPSGGEQQASAGPVMAGVFEGAGHWRLDFIDGGVLVNCAFLSPDQHSYTIDAKSGHLVIDTTPKPLVLTVRGDGSIVGPGPLTIDGVIASGSGGGQSTPGHTETQTTTTHEQVGQSQASQYNPSDLTYQGNGTYDVAHTTTQSTTTPGTTTPVYSTFSKRRATCPALNLTSKGAGVGIQTMQTDLLKTMFGGDKGPPTPPGIRMHGIFAAATGFSVQFFPESAILGCGPDAARAYPYSVAAEGGRAVVKIDAPDHPLMLALKSDGSLEPASAEPYQVHGRTVTGQNDNDDFTFAPFEQTCNLAMLTPSKSIPSGGGTAATMTASSVPAGPGAASGNGSSGLSTPQAPLGNAALSIVAALPPQPGVSNALAGRPYLLLRDSYAKALAKGGVSVPAGVSPYKYVGNACASKTPDCQKINDAIKASAASAVRSDANGNGTLPGVPPGIYHLMISARYNNQSYVWGQPIQLKPGANSVTLDLDNATPIN